MADPVAMRNYLALKKKSYAIKFDLDNTNYTAVENIGTGAYGVVCSAINQKTKQKVAIKKIPGIFGQPTIAKRTYREIKILKHFKHDNIIAIREILHPGDNLDQFKDVYIVLDLMESDLHRIIHSKQELTEEHVRFFTYQILRGLKYVHSANVVHRDLKPSNLLVNENCDLKIGDFGMARGISTSMDDYSMVMTQYVATRWYRAPELIILPKEMYTEAVDMWSVGCILGEMLGRKQLFPGNSHMDQIDRIIDKLGTPSPEYLKMTSTDLITALIMKKGHLKGVSWAEVYPKASKKAVDLLGKMLVLDPRKRMTVTQALKHPFLSKYHDPEDEPVCIPVFNFDFERKSMSTSDLRTVIVEEIMSYHKVKQKSRIQFNFRPVPKSELNQASPTKFDFKPVMAQQNTTSIQSIPDSTTTDVKPGLKDILNTTSQSFSDETVEGRQIQDSTINSNFDGSFERKHSELLQQLKDLQDLQEPNFVNQQTVLEGNDFKKPEGFPLSVKVKDPVKGTEATLKSSNDVEMWSAKSSSKSDSLQLLNVEIKPGEIIDIEMISARSTGQDGSKEYENQTQNNNVLLSTTGQRPIITQDITQQKPVDTKELIRMALLSNERRKQREGETQSKPKPVTAMQKQREREEKRRQKLEKARQRKKKEKKAPSVELTDEDKKMLQKWQNMQKIQPPPKTISDNVASSQKTVAVTLPTDSLPQLVGNVTIPPLGGTFVTTTMPGQLPCVTHTLPADHNVNLSSQSNQTSSIPAQIVSVPHSQTVTSYLTGQQNITPAVGQNGDKMAVITGSSVSTDTSIKIPQATSHQAPITAITAPQNSVTNTVISFGSDAEWPGESQPRLPSYSEALQAKTTSPSEWSKSPKVDPMLPGPTFSPMLQDQIESTDPIPWAACTMDNKPEHRTSKADWDMKIITKQLRQSNVDDLTLTHTPKGTGGGYGVACDLDLLMETAGADHVRLENKPDSAQISPSLFTDWQELTGNIDPHEFESVLSEYMSPISSQELNNVMLSLMSPKPIK